MIPVPTVYGPTSPLPVQQLLLHGETICLGHFFSTNRPAPHSVPRTSVYNPPLDSGLLILLTSNPRGHLFTPLNITNYIKSQARRTPSTSPFADPAIANPSSTLMAPHAPKSLLMPSWSASPITVIPLLSIPFRPSPFTNPPPHYPSHLGGSRQYPLPLGKIPNPRHVLCPH